MHNAWKDRATDVSHRLKRPALAAVLAGAVLLCAFGCARGSDPLVQAQPQKIVTNKSVISTSFGSVRDVAWSPDSKYFAVAQSTKITASIVIYDAKTQKIVKSLEPKKCGPYSGIYESHSGGKVAFSQDGRYLAGGFGIITLWDTKTWQPVRDILGPFVRGANVAGHVKSLIFSPDSLSLAILYSSVLYPEYLHVEGFAAIREIAKRRESDKSITNEPTLIVFDVESGNITFNFKQEHATDKINKYGRMFSGGISYSPDGRYILTNHFGGIRHDFITKDDDPSKYDSRLVFRDAKSGKSMKEFSAIHAMEITASTYSHNGKLIATGTNTGSKHNTRNLLAGPWVWFKNHNEDPIRIWDAETGAKLMELGPLRGSPKWLGFSPDDRVLVSCQTDVSENEIIWIWDLTSGQLIERVRIPRGWNHIHSCALSPDGHTIAITDGDTIYLVHIKQ